MSRRGAWLFAMMPMLGGCHPPPVVEGAPPPRLTLYDVHMQYFQGTKLKSVAQSTEVTYQRGTGGILAEKATLRATRQGAADVFIEATEVDGNLQRKQAEGERGVKVHTLGMLGETERAHYDGLEQKVYGQTPMSTQGPTYSIKAQGFAFDLRAENYQFDGAVRSQMRGIQ